MSVKIQFTFDSVQWFYLRWRQRLSQNRGKNADKSTLIKFTRPANCQEFEIPQTSRMVLTSWLERMVMYLSTERSSSCFCILSWLKSDVMRQSRNEEYYGSYGSFETCGSRYPWQEHAVVVAVNTCYPETQISAPNCFQRNRAIALFWDLWCIFLTFTIKGKPCDRDLFTCGATPWLACRWRSIEEVKANHGTED